MTHTRELTAGERNALSPGLVQALEHAGAAPVIASIVHPAARMASLWRGHTPILTLGQTIHWPGAALDLSASEPDMAVLQHELHHVFEFATGALTALGYLLSPRNWSYALHLTDDARWSDLGAEQRAVAVERLWWAERRQQPAEAARLRGLIPWA